MTNQPEIAMVTCEHVEEALLQQVGAALAEIFGLPVRLTGTVVPLTGWNAERQQYLGEVLLDQVRQARPPRALRVLGLTEVDLYADDMNFIFGQAEVGGRAALVSLYRLRRDERGRRAAPEVVLRRAIIECVHELGHTFGLRHCPLASCVMHFSETVGESDVKGTAFCPIHSRRLAEALGRA